MDRHATGKDTTYESIAKILGQIKKASPINIFTPDPKIKTDVFEVKTKDLTKIKVLEDLDKI